MIYKYLQKKNVIKHNYSVVGLPKLWIPISIVPVVASPLMIKSISIWTLTTIIMKTIVIGILSIWEVKKWPHIILPSIPIVQHTLMFGEWIVTGIISTGIVVSTIQFWLFDVATVHFVKIFVCSFAFFVFFSVDLWTNIEWGKLLFTHLRRN